MTRRHRRVAAAAAGLTLTLGLGVTGCGTGAEGAGASGDAATPREGGTLVYRSAGAGRSNDPATTTGYGPAVPLRGIVDSLVFNNLDGTFEPWLATSWKVNKDATRYQFTLRTDVTFSNGEKLDAAAVKASFDALRADGAKYAVANSWIGDLREITTAAPDQVVFLFASPNSGFLQAVGSAPLGIVAPATSKLTFDDRQDGEGIIGSGAFVVADSQGDEGYTLKRREDYAWPPAPAENQGPARLDGIKVVNIADNSIAAAELRSGGLDLLHNTEPADKTEFASSAEITIRRDPLPGSSLGFAVNVETPGLDDPQVRRALALAIDRDAVLERASSIDLAPRSVFTASNPYFTDQSALIRTDRDEAERLLDEARWTADDDGVRSKDGERLSFDLVYGASTISHEPNLAVVQSQWKEIGVELTFGSLTPAELNQRLAAGNYDLSWGSGTRPDADVLRGNFGGLDPELDELFAAILAEPDFAARKSLGEEASELILQGGFYIPLYDFIQPLAFRNTTHLPLFEASHIPWLGDVWLSR